MSKLKSALKARELKTLFFVTALFLLVGLKNSDFLSISNIMLTLNGSVIYMIVAIGIAFVIMTGEIDVSVGATVGMSAAIAGTIIRDGGSWIVALLAAITVGLVIGAVNGFGVTFLNIPSIIMTLGTMGIFRGMIYVFTQGKWVENIPYEFKELAQKSIGDSVTYFFAGIVVILIVIHILLTKTKKGRYFAAVGDNVGGATLLGIPVRATKMAAFMACGVLAAIGGVMYVSRVGFVTPMAGNGYEMKAIAACVLGGISLTGGVGSVIGAAIGATLMASISRILVFLGISSDYDNTITGILLITIVVVDALIQRHSSEKARRERLSAKTALASQGGTNDE